MAQRPERDRLSRDRIIEAAMQVADQEGISAVTMRRIGSELGVEGMALYRHVPNKAALLFGLVESMIKGIKPEYSDRDDWKDRIKAVMRAYRAAGRAHPSVYMLSLTRPWFGHAFFRFEEDLTTLKSAGFSDEDAGHALRSLTSFTAGFIARDVARTQAHLTEDGHSVDPAERREMAARFGQLAKSYESLVEGGEAGFEFGLSALVEGLSLALCTSKDLPQEEAPQAFMAH